MLKKLARLYSYCYHFVLALFLLAVGAIALFSSRVTLSLDMLPWWEEPTLTYVVLLAGLAGLFTLALAVTGKTQILFRLWTVAVFGVIFYGYFVTRFGFHSPDHFFNAVLLTLGALLAMIGSWTRVRKRA